MSEANVVCVAPQWRYREQYEQAKDKFTSILDTPEYEAHKRSKKISDVSSVFPFPTGCCCFVLSCS